MMTRPGEGERGQSLVELSISIAVSVPLILGAGILFHDAMESMSTTADRAKVGRSLRAGLDILRDDLLFTDVDHVTIDESDPDHDTLLIQIPVKMGTAGPEWGALVSSAASGGQRQVGWSIRYRVEGRKLVREVIDDVAAVREVARIVLDRVDQTRVYRGASSKGFRVWKMDPVNQPRLLSLSVRTRGAKKGGEASGASSSEAGHSAEGRMVFQKELRATVRIGEGS